VLTRIASSSVAREFVIRGLSNSDTFYHILPAVSIISESHLKRSCTHAQYNLALSY